MLWSGKVGGIVKRVVILGRGGSGKSTLAVHLGELTGLPVVELDQHFWQRDLAPTLLRNAITTHATSATVHIFRHPHQLNQFTNELSGGNRRRDNRPRR
jgi:adenylate kinase family enzyme